MGKVWTQNNVWAGAKAIVEGRQMEFANDEEAYEYIEEDEDEV